MIVLKYSGRKTQTYGRNMEGENGKWEECKKAHGAAVGLLDR